MPVYSELANSTYPDLTSYRGNAALPGSNLLLSSFTVNVALVLDRVNDPTALLSSPWATRQAALADQTAIFQTYGADPTDYNTVLTALGSGPGGLGIPTVDQVGANGYVSSVESRTI